MHLLRRPRLALLIGGGALNEIGSWAAIIAFWGYAAYRFHSSPDQIALVSIMWAAPGALFGLFSGVPIDRFGPRRILLVANAWGALVALAMTRASSYGQLVVLVLLSGLVGAFGRPATNALVPRLVDDAELLSANALIQLTTQVAIVVGPLVASVTISVWSIKGAFYVDAASFVAGFLSLLPVRLRPVAEDPGGGSADHGRPSDYLAGARLFLRSAELRRYLTLATVVFVTWGASMVMEPLYVRDILHRSSATFGWLQSIFGVGLIAAAVALPRLGERVVNLRAQAATLLVSAVAVPMYLASYNLAFAYAGIALWGVATGLFLAPFYTLVQRGSPAAAHGRVMAVAATANGTAQLCAIPLAGVAVTLVGIRTTAVVEMAGLIVAGGLGWSWARAAAAPGDGDQAGGAPDGRASAGSAQAGGAPDGRASAGSAQAGGAPDGRASEGSAQAGGPSSSSSAAATAG